MSKTSKNLDRVKEIILVDERNVSNDFEQLLKKDLIFLLKDYFDIGDNLDISIDKNTNDYTVCVSFKATHLHNFKKMI